jgi:hypothetical protein
MKFQYLLATAYFNKPSNREESLTQEEQIFQFPLGQV